MVLPSGPTPMVAVVLCLGFLLIVEHAHRPPVGVTRAFKGQAVCKGVCARRWVATTEGLKGLSGVR